MLSVSVWSLFSLEPNGPRHTCPAAAVASAVEVNEWTYTDGNQEDGRLTLDGHQLSSMRVEGYLMVSMGVYYFEVIGGGMELIARHPSSVVPTGHNRINDSRCRWLVKSSFPHW